MDSLPPQPMILILLILIVLSIINTLSRTASVAVSDSWLKQQAEDGNRRAKRLFALIDRSPSGMIDGLELISVILLITIAVFSFSVLYMPLFQMTENIFGNKVATEVIHTLAIVIDIVIICLCYMVFIVLVPRRIGAKSPEKTALLLVGYTKIACAAMRPFLWINTFFATIFSKLLGVKAEELGEEVTEEEIRMLVDMGSESGAIDDDEKQMIHNIFELDDKPVEEIMTHRTELCILWIEDDIDEWKRIVDETNHTRYPVCGESIDDVLGVVSTRDFYRLLLNGETDVKSILRDAWFIPDTIKADELFSKMQQENEHMGIVMDEYGGFQGIVTQEDLIEEIVGELYSEYDEPEVEDKEIIQLDENTWEISGSAPIEDVEEALGIEIEDGDFNTFAGLILSELQAIPADGETVELETKHMSIKVTAVQEHRI
ncbi:MAG: HlyC/CorC family transporter, partial [Clostridia bacterium]|nr:HlyC/CorC family transporter [Clostridia bacterium]